MKNQAYQLYGCSTKDYITGLYEQSAILTDEAIRAGVDTVAEKMKQDILNAPDKPVAAERIYYVSEKSGNDGNDGRSPKKAWKTPAALNTILPSEGTAAILFERGGIYRGSFTPLANTYVGAYGEGTKPLLMQSKRNYADESLWKPTEWKNVYKCTEQLVNVGVVGFDHDLFRCDDGVYNEQYGLIMNKGAYGFEGPADLCGDLQFYSVIPDKETNLPGDFYLYCEDSNPGKRFHSIEIGENIRIIGGWEENVTIENLAFKFTGNNVGGTGVKNRVIRSCVFSWIGGSVLGYYANGSPYNYGNAVEVYGKWCENFRVKIAGCIRSMTPP